jgi:sugar-specific transcriptional regulator TrmB
MENTNEKILIEAGLSEEQAVIYSSLLDKGPMKAGPISKWTGVKKGLVYKVLDQLENMGLVEKKGGEGTVTLFSPLHPSRLSEIMEQKEKALKLAKETLNFSLGNLSSKFNLLSGKPNVQFFEGDEGIMEVINDSLTAKETILQYVDNEMVKDYLPKENKDYVNKRIKLKIKKKMLSPESAYIREHAKEMDKEFTELRILKNNLPSNTVMQIYNDKISYLTLKDNKKIGIIVEDQDIANMHKNLFNIHWEIGEKLL